MSKTLYGYFGKQLRVSLSTGEIESENIDVDILRKYIGGVGYGARVLYDELEKGIDPLSPDNKIVFATSPLTSNNIPGGGSIMACFKSPLTNIWGESRSGGNFGPDLRKTGFDAVAARVGPRKLFDISWKTIKHSLENGAILIFLRAKRAFF